MALLTRKGGGLPANYREVYFWLNHVEVPVETPELEPVRTATETPLAEAAVAQSAAGKNVAAAAESAQVEEEPKAEAIEVATADAATEIAMTAHAETAEPGAETGPEAATEAALKEGGTVEAETTEAAPVVAAADEPIAETPEAVSKSEPAQKLANVRELPKRGGTMTGLNDETATEQNAGEKSDTEEKGRSRGFLGFRRRKRA